MSIEFETREENRSIERPEKIPRHTHDGINSVQIDLRDVKKKVLPKDNGKEYLYNGEPVFDGPLQGYGGSAPQLTTKVISDGGGNLVLIVDPASITNVNAWLSDTNEMLIDIKKRQETHSRVFINNGFATYQQNPSSDAFDPLFTYFDRQ